MASYSGVWTSPAGHNWACCSPTRSAGVKCSNAWNLALAEISCPSRAKPASASALSKALQRSSNCAAASALAEKEGMLELQNGRLLASIVMTQRGQALSPLYLCFVISNANLASFPVALLTSDVDVLRKEATDDLFNCDRSRNSNPARLELKLAGKGPWALPMRPEH